jgi:hypothetical protein
MRYWQNFARKGVCPDRIRTSDAAGSCGRIEKTMEVVEFRLGFGLRLDEFESVEMLFSDTKP